ncbi:sensor histidine kinase [Nonomuraea sp. M3C6]|uniref:histidine kinase n=1 Tax=Nonomuraea marmarensis TaxID=3351344 RepID=A0ABW7AM57_9ACTN
MALVIGALALVTVLRDNLLDEVRSDALARGQEVAESLESDRAPPGLPVTVPDEELIQVLDRNGAVVASSSNIAGRPAVARLRPGESVVFSSPLDHDDDFLALAVVTRDGRFKVIVGRALVDVFESVQIVARLLVIGLPVLLLVVGMATWKVVGRALAPVEAMRREVDEISAAELHRRVPAPSRTDEIARLSTTMNSMLDRLERAQTSQRRFISDASHELRSPVASIRQHAEVALAHPGRTTLAELAGVVLTEDLRVQRLVEDLLLLARADESLLTLRGRPVDLDDLVFDEARRLRSVTGLRIDTSAVSAGRLEGEAAGLRRILRNLGDNATRHARTRVAFALTERGESVVLTVDDDGPGVAASERIRIFERFVRLDDARTRDHGGSGLGLAIVAELVRAHGGTAVAETGDWGGARFRVTLPR